MNSSKFTLLIMITALLMTVAAGVIFLSNPEIDLYVERWFHEPDKGFMFNDILIITVLRKIITLAYIWWYAAIIIAAVVSSPAVAQQPPRYLGLNLPDMNFRKWIYLVVTSLTGPLLIANIILKNNWGRARPRQVEEFGGTQQFSPPLALSDQCDTNCSFVSGEPSSMFMIFISLAFILPAKRGVLVALTIVMGGLSGVMRMGQGGHFLSDVVFAGLFMTLTAAVIYWAMFLSRWAKGK
jgi:lipid A 4'-phosphatase